MPDIPATINNAIANAIGARIFELLIVTDSVWRAIRGTARK
jgi:CO/xanthine dehydrogenase Mo-binding subunit